MRDNTLAALSHDLQLLIEPIDLRPDRWLRMLVTQLGAVLLGFNLGHAPLDLDRSAGKPEPNHAVAPLATLPPVG